MPGRPTPGPMSDRHASPGGAIAVGIILLCCGVMVGMVIALLGYGLWRLLS